MIWFLLIGALLVFLSVASPFLGLVNYMFILYLRPMEVYPELSRFYVAKVFAIATIIGFLIKYNQNKKIFFNNKQDKVLLFLLFTILLSFIVGWIPQCMLVLEQMAKNVIVYVLIVGLVTTEKRAKIFGWALLIFSAILAFNTFQEYRELNYAALHTVRLGGFSGGYFGGSGDFAVMMSVVIPYAFFFGTTARPFILRPISLTLMGIIIAGIVSTQARGGLIAFGATMFGIGYLGLKSKKGFQKFISVVLVAASIAGIVAFAPSAFKERAGSIINYKHVGTANARIEYWKLGIKMFISNPLIGVGAGNYPIRYNDFGGWEKKWRVSHNMYIEALAELGILGFACLFFLLYYTFKDAIATRRFLEKKEKTDTPLYYINQAAMLSLLAYCVGGMFQSIFTYPILYIILAYIIAIKNIAIKPEPVKVKKRRSRKK